MQRPATRSDRGRWVDYRSGEPIGTRIEGLSKRDSFDAAKHDGGAGVVVAPDGRKVFWEGVDHAERR